MTEPEGHVHDAAEASIQGGAPLAITDAALSSSAQNPILDRLPADLQTFTQMIAKFGPDTETTKILAESERHAEDNKLEAYKANLDHRNKENVRDHEFRMKQLVHAAIERYIILVLSSLALIAGAILTIKGNPAVGNPIMSAALTVLITLISGKWKQNS